MDTPDSSQAKIVWHEHTLQPIDRNRLMGHSACVVWFTGLSGSGKSTIANATEKLLFEQGIHTFLLDGDNVRHGLCASEAILSKDHAPTFAKRFGLAFGAEDREENIRRVGAVTQLFAAAGLITLTAFVSPYRRDRDRVRQWVESQGKPGDFIEVFVDTPLEICEQRDPKGLYQQARQGKIASFTGISDPYEAPLHPELILKSAEAQPIELAQQVVDYLKRAGKLGPQQAA